MSPVVTIPEAPAAAGTGKRRWRIPITVWLLLALAVLVFIGIELYRSARETRIIFNFNLGELTLAESPAIVYNFTGRLDLLRADLARRLEPINTEFDEIQSYLAAARADLAGKLEKKRLLKTQVDKLAAEIPAIASLHKTELDDLWIGQGDALEKEFADTKEQLRGQLEDRAARIGVAFKRNEDIDSLDVDVNAFKLALYNAPKTVKVEDERKAADELLAEWQKFQDDWQKRVGALKEKSEAIRKQPGPKIAEVEDQIAKTRNDIAGVDADIASFQQEIRRHEQRLEELNAQANEVTGRFLTSLHNAPKDFIKTRLTPDAEGVIELKDLRRRAEEFPPGDYYLFAVAKKDNEIYWAVKKFTVRENVKESVTVRRADFIPARLYLTKGNPQPGDS